MRVLLDECVNAGVRAAFPGDIVKTVSEIGWRGTEDGSLLEFAQTQFDVFVTIDRSLERQNDLKKFLIGFVVVRVRSNEISAYRPIFNHIQEAAQRVRSGEVVYVAERH